MTMGSDPVEECRQVQRLTRMEGKQTTMQRDMAALKAGQDKLADETLGKVQVNYDGERTRKGGIKGDVAEIKADVKAILANGIVRTKIPWTEWLKGLGLVATLIGGIKVL